MGFCMGSIFALDCRKGYFHSLFLLHENPRSYYQASSAANLFVDKPISTAGAARNLVSLSIGAIDTHFGIL